MDRFVLTDAQWAKMAPLCLGKPTAAVAAITACFLKRCCGLRAPAARDAICRRCSATGIRCSNAIAIG